MDIGYETSREQMKKEIDTWDRQLVKASVQLCPEMFPYDQRKVWINLFLKYNTSLPSSAAVERLFSTASDVLRAKRSSLTAENFENLIFKKGNMELMGKHWKSKSRPKATE